MHVSLKRITSLYSYNVLDNPAYIQSKKTEQKIIKIHEDETSA